MALLHSYPYTTRWSAIVFFLVIFGVGVVYAVSSALSVRGKLVINGVITLDPPGARIFYWCMAVGSFLLFLYGLMMLWQRGARPTTLELHDDELLLPSGFVNQRVDRIPYATIDRLWEIEPKRNLFFLHIKAGGEEYSISASQLPNRESYDEVRGFLSARLPHALDN